MFPVSLNDLRRPISIRAPAADSASERALGLLREQGIVTAHLSEPVRNSASFWEEIFFIAEQLDRAGAGAPALELYALVAAASGETACDQSFEERARQAQHAILGDATLNFARAEHLLRNFSRSALHPTMVGSFLIAGSAAHAASLVTRQLLAPRLGLGPAATAVSALLSELVVEVPVFVAAHRGLADLIGSENASQSWEHDLFSAALFLTPLKLGRDLAFFARAFSPRHTQTLTNLSSLGAIYLGHRLQELAELRASPDEAGRWADVLDAFFQMRVGGRFAQNLGLQPTASPLESLARLNLARANTELRFLRLGETGAALRYRMAAQAEEFDDLDTKPNFRPDAPPLERLLLRLGSLLQGPMRADLEQIGKLSSNPDRFYELMEASRIRESAVLEASLRRTRAMFEHSRTGGLRGNYLSWVVRLAVERVMGTGDAARLDNLLRSLYHGGTMRDFEEGLRDIFPDGALFPQDKAGALRRLTQWLHTPRALRKITALPLSHEARSVLSRFAERPRENFSEILDAFSRQLSSNPDQVALVERIIIQAGSSPLGAFRIHRLLQVVAAQPNLHPKIYELADLASPILAWDGARAYPVEGSQIRNTWADAYLDDPTFADYLSAFYLHRSRLLNPLQAQLAWERTLMSLQQATPAAKPLIEADMLRALRMLGDPASRAVLESLLQGRTALRIEEESAFLEMARRINPRESGQFLMGFFLPRGEHVAQDTFFIRQIKHTSTTAFHPVFFQRLATLIHEYEHHLMPPQQPRTRISVLREEMVAHLRTIAWRAEHGDIAEAVERDSHALGFAMSLRDRVEMSDLVPTNENF